MEHLLKGRLFSWLKGDTQEMMDEDVELMILEFVNDLVVWSDSVRDYSEVVRGLESLHIRLQVWNEIYQADNEAVKKCKGRLVPVCGIESGGTGNSAGTGTGGEPGMVRGASG